MVNITSSQTFAHFGLGFVVLKAGKPLGIYGCSSQFAVCSSQDFRPFQTPAPLAQWPGAHKYAIILHFPLLRSIFIYSHMAFAALRRCGLTHISPCLWHSRLSGGDSKLTFTQRCGCPAHIHISRCDIFICWFIYLLLFICIICIWHIFMVPFCAPSEIKILYSPCK